MSWFALVVGVFGLAFSLQNVLAWYQGRTLKLTDSVTDDYTIVVPLYGDPKYFEAKEGLEPIKQRVLVTCEISTAVMADYADQLETEGWQVCRAILPAPNTALVVREGVNHVTTRYALRLDADTQVDARISNAVAAVAASGVDLASTNVEVLTVKTVAQHFQALEYRMAMLSRRWRPWLTSGALFIGRTEALQAIFAQHSMWTSGEDIETGRIALALGMKIRYVDYIARTDAPATFRSLFRQRELWWAGTFRHAIVNLDRNAIQLPMYSLYNILGCYLAIYYHVWTLVSPSRLLLVIAVGLVGGNILNFISNIQVASPLMLLFPFYAMFQSFVLPVFGAVQYLKMAAERKSLGRYQFGYMPHRMR